MTTSTAETAALADAVRRMLADRLPPATLVHDLGSDSVLAAVDMALHHDIGLAGLLVPESSGGLGGSLADAVAVATELGRACAPSDFVTSTVLTGPLLAEIGDARPQTTTCLVVPWDSAPGRRPRSLSVTDGRVTGEIRSVAGATRAELLVVPLDVDGAFALGTCDPGDAGLVRVTSLDLTRPLTDITFTGAPVTVLATGDAAASAFDAALLRAGVALAAEQVGLAQWCLAATIEHVQQRRQFGRLIGSFQAVKHRLAQLWIDVDAADVAARAAGSAPDDLSVLAGVAQSWCSEVALHVAEECVQLHGGIGMTWEHPAHVYLKRAATGVAALGTPEQHRRRLGTEVDLLMA